jgi:hypothetical protein
VLGSASTVPDTQGGLTLIGDTDPAYDSMFLDVQHGPDDLEEHWRSAERPTI